MADQDKILLVDDDEEIRILLSRLLEKEGFEVETAEGVAAMRVKMQRFDPDLLILDLMMPGEDGISAARTLRLSSNLPILMLTAKGEELDRIIGLEIGADDYMAKPFNPRELIARIRSILRRTKIGREYVQPLTHVTFDDFEADINKRVVKDSQGRDLGLTSGEFEVLKVFLNMPGKVVNRSLLMERTKGRTLSIDDRSIDIQISRLRLKLEADPKKPELIKTIRGSGYMFVADIS